jgi:ferredoxin
MPWIDKEKCTGCGICVEKCPTNTIVMEGEKAKIDMDNCIRCGICHDVCPTGAVRHDSEKTPGEVKANVEKTKGFMEECARSFNDKKEAGKCLNRMIKHFNKEKIVAEKTLQELEKIKTTEGEQQS